MQGTPPAMQPGQPDEDNAMTRTPDTPITRGPLTLIRGNAPRFARTDWRRHVVQPAPAFPALPDVNQAAHPLAAGFYLDRATTRAAGMVRVVAVDRCGRRVFEATVDGRLCYAMEAAGIFAAAGDVMQDLMDL